MISFLFAIVLLCSAIVSFRLAISITISSRTGSRSARSRGADVLPVGNAGSSGHCACDAVGIMVRGIGCGVVVRCSGCIDRPLVVLALSDC